MNVSPAPSCAGPSVATVAPSACAYMGRAARAPAPPAETRPNLADERRVDAPSPKYAPSAPSARLRTPSATHHAARAAGSERAP